MHRFVVACESPRFRVRGAAIRSSLAGVLRKLKVARDISFEVFLISDAEMGRINMAARHKRGPATVLSFPASAAKRRAAGRFPRPDLGCRTRYLGEIYLAPDYARRCGQLLPVIALHGLLHLMGYTHKGKRDTMKMERMEKVLMKNAKIKSKSDEKLRT